MYKKRTITFIGIAIALLGILFQISMQSAMRSYARDGIYFQVWSSEAMMQTVSIKELSERPLKTLLNIHIQPPALDVIRAIFVHIWPASDPDISVKHVDYLLYKLWTLLYGLLGSLIFFWVYRFTNIRFAVIAAVAFLLHPACISYATLLDTTLLTSFLTSLMYYQLWKVRNKYYVSPYALTAITLALFFTRSIFQWQFILLVGVSLFFMKMPRRTLLIFLLISGGVSGVYMAKQYYQFRTFSTSSFTGLNLTRSVGMGKSYEYLTYLDSTANLDSVKNELPNVLTQTKKINGKVNYNHISYLQLNEQFITAYKKYMRTTPVKSLIKSYRKNLEIYFTPSSRYTSQVIVDRIPWRSFYDQVFSYPILTALIFISGISYLMRAAKRKDLIVSLALALPGLYIFLVTILFEKGENMRFKFFLEPVVFVFLVSELYTVGRQISQRLLRPNGTVSASSKT